jgi:sulfate transport system substrate-binding protein
MVPTPLRFLLPLLLVLVAGAVSACGGVSESSSANSSSAGGGDGGGRLSLVAYSTPREAYEELIPEFGGQFSQSYGSSGDQARAVEAGLRADVVALSLAPDVDKLVEAGLVAPDWNQDRFDGFVTNSVVSFMVRKGNPENIRTWDDLTREGVEVVTPNAFSSGGARWNVMAAYGSQIEQGKTPAQAREYLTRLYENVVAQDKSARESLATFVAGKGDVLIGYENEAITAQQKGEDVDYVTPDETILIENPVAVTSKSQNPQRAREFVTFLRSPEAQRVFAEKGYRSVRPDLVDEQRFPTPSGLFEIDDLGGWDRVMDEFFDPAGSVLQRIFEAQGIATE